MTSKREQNCRLFAAQDDQEALFDDLYTEIADERPPASLRHYHWRICINIYRANAERKQVSSDDHEYLLPGAPENSVRSYITRGVKAGLLERRDNKKEGKTIVLTDLGEEWVEKVCDGFRRTFAPLLCSGRGRED